jgi:hypothetical protein
MCPAEGAEMTLETRMESMAAQHHSGRGQVRSEHVAEDTNGSCCLILSESD